MESLYVLVVCTSCMYSILVVCLGVDTSCRF